MEIGAPSLTVRACAEMLLGLPMQTAAAEPPPPDGLAVKATVVGLITNPTWSQPESPFCLSRLPDSTTPARLTFRNPPPPTFRPAADAPTPRGRGLLAGPVAAASTSAEPIDRRSIATARSQGRRGGPPTG